MAKAKPVDLAEIRRALERDAKDLVELRRKIIRYKKRQVEQALIAMKQGKPVPKIQPVPYERTIFNQTEATLDRVLGKPKQEVKVEGQVSVHHQLAARLEKWRQFEQQQGNQEYQQGGGGAEDGGDG